MYIDKKVFFSVGLYYYGAEKLLKITVNTYRSFLVLRFNLWPLRQRIEAPNLGSHF